MKKYTILFFAVFTLLCNGCKVTQPTTSGDPNNAVSYGYQPLDPLAVDLRTTTNQTTNLDPLSYSKEVLNVLSDETIRIATAEVSGSVNLSYGPAKIGYKGHSYEVIVDYMKFQTQPKYFKYKMSGGEITALHNLVPPIPDSMEMGSVPIYLGVGLRLKASIRVNEGSVDLSNLFGIGLAAEAKKVSGTLVVQTLGISGDKITGLIPMPSDLSVASLQNAIMALATIKSKIYDESTRITPRVLGFYNTYKGSKELVNSFISDVMTGNPIILLPR